MNQETQQDFPFPPQQEIPPANSSHEYGGGSDSAVPLPLLNGIGGGFTVLQLPQPTTTSSSAIKPPLRKCSSCGFGSAKKRSPPPPSSLSSLYEPCSKRPAISSTTSSPHHPTPPSSSERERQKIPLRRSLSDFPCSPIGFGGACYQDFPNPAAAAFLKNPLSPSQMLPGNPKISRIPHLDSFPMVPLHRSPSNLSSSDYDTPPVNTTPPRPPPSSAERKRSPLPLRRSLSDFPCSPIGGGAYYQDFPNPVGVADASSLKRNPLSYPSQMPQSCRLPSNPFSSSEYYEQQAVNTTPPRPRVRPQMFDHHHGTPNSKKLRREVKGKVEELMQLMDQADCEQQQEEEEEEEEEEEDDDDDVYINKEKGEMMNHNENEGVDDESVWVKQTEGGGLILHFKCCCGEGYEVYLHGDKCYYRLS